MSKRFLRNILNPRLSDWWLRNVLGPWLGERSLRNVFNVSLLNGWWLDDLYVFNWICWRYDSLDFLVSLVFNFFPSIVSNNCVIIERISIIEVLV